jgi:hypothetical protein
MELVDPCQKDIPPVGLSQSWLNLNKRKSVSDQNNKSLQVRPEE